MARKKNTRASHNRRQKVIEDVKRSQKIVVESDKDAKRGKKSGKYISDLGDLKRAGRQGVNKARQDGPVGKELPVKFVKRKPKPKKPKKRSKKVK